MKDNILRRILNYKSMSYCFLFSFIVFISLDSLRDRNYITGIDTVYWIFSIICVTSGILTVRTAKVENTYKKGGYLYSWYDDTMKWKGVNWIKNVADKIIERGILDVDEKPIVFVGPSANKGVYEKVLFEHFQEKKISCKFIISDLTVVDNHETSFKGAFGEYLYLEDSNNAKDIDLILKKSEEEKADIIWDSIGCIWHAKESLWHKKKKAVAEICDIFKRYADSLNSGGLIVVDNIKSSPSLILLRQISHLLGHGKFGAGEQSTGAYLMELCNDKKDNEFKNYMKEHFEVSQIDTVNEFNTTLSVLVFKKN